ncbi:AAC(3) family N-acetyltransferase [Enterovibrio sp. 27052020O]|uniref:AAC(3) family N-acetyltransferase n=1 Tax=Enterovibrio sp. 27052020O TaxID=3241166 RepID=UPI00388D321A
MNRTPSEIEAALHTLSLRNKVLFVHASMRSLGKLDGGAAALLDILLEAGCTVIVPAFNYDTLCLPPSDYHYTQNGHRGEWQFENIFPFDANANVIEPSMGAFAAAVVNHPNRVRTEHPISSFAGVGPKAAAVLAHQTDIDVYAHYNCEDASEAIVLAIGVMLNSITPIHFAEQLAGRELFRRWARTASRGDVEVCIGSCSEGFHQLEDTLRHVGTTANVGLAAWTAYPLASLVTACQHAIVINPTITQCSIDCPRCQDMVNGGLATSEELSLPEK